MSRAVVAWRRSVYLFALVAAVSASTACEVDKNSMLAPTGSTVTVASGATLMPASTTQSITVRMAASDGSAVPDGTEVWLSATRGRLDQQKQRTQGGTVSVGYHAPAEAGPAEVTATSAEARGSLALIVTSAPVTALSVSASPAELAASGGETEIVAVVRGPEGQGVQGVPVAFEASAGSLASKAATTDGNGNVRVGFATDKNAEVTAVVAGLASGSLRATASVKVKAQAPAPSPGPGSPAPGPSLPPDPGVPFSLSEVVWLHADASTWRQTSTITQVSFDPLCLQHTKAGRWPAAAPDGVPVEANPWIFANIGGRWYAATYEWLKPGQVCKPINAGNIGAHTKRPPIEGWRPRSGELVGFMVSALARTSLRTVEERSNVVMVRWP